jgi:hypothetical protein
MISTEKLDRVAYRLLGEPSLFSRFVVGRPLRPYQLSPARAILRSVLDRRGDQLSVALPRLAGKVELSAQLEAYLLNLRADGGGGIVKVVPGDRPRLEASQLRLEWALDNPLNHGRWRREVGGVRLGWARCRFLPADQPARAIRAAAPLLLEVERAQDVESERHEPDLVEPAGAATRVYYGTAWREDDLLQRVRAAGLERERRDGVRRHFEYPWWVVAESSREYGRHVEAERARLGDEHPLFRSQYRLEPLGGEARLFSARQRELMRGDHPRLSLRPDGAWAGPAHGACYVAGVAPAGSEEGADARPADEDRPLLVTVARVAPTTVAESVVEPRLEVVALARLVWRDGAGDLIAALRDRWRVRRVLCGAPEPTAGPVSRMLPGVPDPDADPASWMLPGAPGPTAGPTSRVLSGAPEPFASPASRLRDALGDVVRPLPLTAESRSRLAFTLLAAVGGRRFAIYRTDGAADDGPPDDCAAELWRAVERGRCAPRAGGQLACWVPGHDPAGGFLLSAALCAQAGRDLVVPPPERAPAGSADTRAM